MQDVITADAAGAALAELFLPSLLGKEDFDAFERDLSCGIRDLARTAFARVLEAFDAHLRESRPRGWSVHEIAPRTLITLLGAVTYRRTVYLDEYGRRRALADELLGIPPRSRLSAGAFLWIVERASEESFRKTARAFFGLTGARISHVTVMRCVHAEGELLKRAPEKVRHLSCEGIRIEVDGLWIPLQAEEHREGALPRFLYEQARKRASLELKVASVYAGKVREGPGRKRRLGLRAIALDADADSFFDRVWEHVASEYDEEDLRRIHYGADGGSWCGPERMEERAPENAEVLFSLDRFHLMRAICRAYPEGPSRDWACSLALRGKGSSLARMAERIADKLAGGPRKGKVRALASCAASNAHAIRAHGASLGTAEATNSRIASRMKGRAMSWSRRGAEAMALVRCALMSGRALIAPEKKVFFTEREIERMTRAGVRSAGEVPARSGRGYLPPHQVDTRRIDGGNAYALYRGMANANPRI